MGGHNQTQRDSRTLGDRLTQIVIRGTIATSYVKSADGLRALRQ
jgi:hypothetical protein